MTSYKIESVLVPDDTYKKLGIISKQDDIAISQIASQAIQEWISIHFGSRYPKD
tara:strand:+ start:377 stop:538 length:162 start_codon:yes stop_codon:yes gene_type:complete